MPTISLGSFSIGLNLRLLSRMVTYTLSSFILRFTDLSEPGVESREDSVDERFFGLGTKGSRVRVLIYWYLVFFVTPGLIQPIATTI